MELSRKELEREIEASENTLAAHIKGQKIHQVVIAAFKEKLALLPAKEMLKEIKKDAHVLNVKGSQGPST